jgi:katanin p60 ATPase-containing subunit A1
MLQVQQQIAQEYEQVKATTNTIQLFKLDTHVDRPIGEHTECCDKEDWAQVRDVGWD